jgi:histidinol dehydrogenase
MRRTSLIKCDLNSLSSIAPAAIKIAENEGLGAHALSMKIRLNKFKNEK